MQDNPATSPVSPPAVASWRIVLAAILDFLTAFVVLVLIVAKATGNTTDAGFELNGWPALLLFALIVAYFVIGNRAGGTLWKRILRVPVRRAA
jgi:uncharacterized RDD family membrane protein YckC